MADAAGVLCRRRRRPARRYRPARHDRPRRAVLRAIRKTLRAGAGHRRRLRLLLRRQRRDARLLRRHHRHQERLDRHGRPRDDRGRRPRRLSSGRSRPGVVPVAERRHRHPGRGRGGSDGCGAKVPVVFPGRGRRLESAGPAPAAAGDPGKPPAGLRYPDRDRSAGRRGLGAGNPQRLRRRHDHRLHPHRGQAVRPDRQQSKASRRRDRCAGRRQGRALHAALRCLRHPDRCRCAIRRASWSVPKPKRPRSCAMSRGCS